MTRMELKHKIFAVIYDTLGPTDASSTIKDVWGDDISKQQIGAFRKRATATKIKAAIDEGYHTELIEEIRKSVENWSENIDRNVDKNIDENVDEIIEDDKEDDLEDLLKGIDNAEYVDRVVKNIDNEMRNVDEEMLTARPTFHITATESGATTIGFGQHFFELTDDELKSLYDSAFSFIKQTRQQTNSTWEREEWAKMLVQALIFQVMRLIKEKVDNNADV